MLTEKEYEVAPKIGKMIERIRNCGIGMLEACVLFNIKEKGSTMEEILGACPNASPSIVGTIKKKGFVASSKVWFQGDQAERRQRRPNSHDTYVIYQLTPEGERIIYCALNGKKPTAN